MLVSAVGLYRDVEELLAARGIEADHDLHPNHRIPAAFTELALAI